MAGASSPFAVRLDIRGEEALQKSFSDFGGLVRLRVRAALADLAQEIVIREKSGFHTKAGTGRTAASIGYDMKEDERGITARIRPDGSGWKAIFKESGVNGRFWVKNVRSGFSRSKFGRQRWTEKITNSAKLGWYREVHIAARPFVRPAWDAVQGRVQATIEAAIEQAKKEAGLA